MNGGECPVTIPVGETRLSGDLCLPEGATGLVVFAHGSGSSRLSTRNRRVAAGLRQARLGTLLFDLLTSSEESIDNITAELRFNIPFLGERLVSVTDWLGTRTETRGLSLGYFGASTGAAAALVAAAQRPERVAAVVSRGGRPDLAAEYLGKMAAPTLLIVGGDDTEVIRLNEIAMEQLHVEKELAIVPGATHLFEEPGKLDEVQRLAGKWFVKYLTANPG
ncbi:dienelactone hydrolase family protein [Dehalogenimonas sp. THU2]|uniref:dienelactone hydrolase family protein n=1 Tax=Dehalogenimonas sp. THU2 TaxID=3151121 RepID=UPI0032184CB8